MFYYNIYTFINNLNLYYNVTIKLYYIKMEAPMACIYKTKNDKLDLPKVDIETFLELGEQTFKLQIGKSSTEKEVSMVIDHEESLSKYCYGLRMNVDEFFKLGKTFRQCDTC